MRKPISLLTLPVEILDLIIEHLTVQIGIQKAVLLRTVNRGFDGAILRAICDSQVVDIDDPATPCLKYRMEATLRGRIFAVKSRARSVTASYLSVVLTVNKVLDSMIDDDDPELVRLRHESIAGAVLLSDDPVDAKMEALDILCGAAVVGCLPVVKSLLTHDDIDVNGVTPYFHSPLTLAAGQGHLSIVQYLLDHCAQPDSMAGRWSCVRGLVSQADWSSADEEIRFHSLLEEFPSALRSAVLNSHTCIVDLLLRPQHRLPADSLEYLRAIVAGAKAGRLDLILRLFEVIGKSLSDFAGLGNVMLWEATRHGQGNVVQWLLGEGVSINAFSRCYRTKRASALQIAASLGNISMVRVLLSRGANVNFNGLHICGNLPIEEAARCGQDQVVDLLIDHGADPSKALEEAARGCQPRLVKLLLNRLPDLPNRKWGDVSRMALTRALESRNLTVITMLVEAGVCLNNSTRHWLQPLKFAKENGLRAMATHLISLGAEEIDDELHRYEQFTGHVRGIHISERTWEWVGKY